jgi:hypothetical protein
VTITFNVRRQIFSSEEDARLTEAEKAFRNLEAEMRAFGNVDRVANQIAKALGRTPIKSPAP